MRLAGLIGACAMLAMPAIALADTNNRLPEPEMLALLAGAAAAWGIVHWIRRK